MRLTTYVLAAVWLTTATTHATTNSSTGQASAALRGAWRSAALELPLATEFDESVWGKNAKSVRTVDMTVRATGEATVTVRRRVLDARGRVVKGSESIERAELRFAGDGPAQPASSGRLDLPVTVVAAERLYPDDPASRWPIEGLRVGLTRFADDPATIEVRVDTPEGQGSFWETLHRRKP